MADNIVKLVSRLLDIICPTWPIKLIGLGSDGEAKMTGQFQGVVTELEKKAEYPIYRTWCGLHQLDLVMQVEYKNLSVLDKAFVTLTVQYIGHLRQQYKLIAEMRSTCPKLANRWVIMGNVCDWFLQHRVRLLQFAGENANMPTVVENTPPHYWWIVVAAMAAITNVINITFVKLQSKDLLVSQQLEELGELAARICSGVGVEGPYDAEDAALFWMSICGLSMVDGGLKRRQYLSFYMIKGHLWKRVWTSWPRRINTLLSNPSASSFFKRSMVF